jgi:sugar phosphate isomerase/epimerase
MRIGFMMPYDPKRIEFAKRHGFGSTELQVRPGCGFFPGDVGWKEKADKVKHAFVAADLRISCLACFYVNHMDDREADRDKELVRNSILLAEKMGVGVVGGFSGRIMGEDLPKSLPKFREIWSEHAKFADDHGIRIAFEHCPMGWYNTPAHGNNMICTPGIWERAFNEVPSDALGLEWDASHLVCMFIDPVANLRQFGKRVYHVHAKDAHVHRDLLEKYGFWHPGVTEHCFPGLGDTNWALVVKELLRQGYTNDLNIEGWHDAVFRDHKDKPPPDVAQNVSHTARRDLEDAGLLLALKHLSQFVPAE